MSFWLLQILKVVLVVIWSFSHNIKTTDKSSE